MLVGLEAIGHPGELRIGDDLVPYRQIESGAVVLDRSAFPSFKDAAHDWKLAASRPDGNVAA